MILDPRQWFLQQQAQMERYAQLEQGYRLVFGEKGRRLFTLAVLEGMQSPKPTLDVVEDRLRGLRCWVVAAEAKRLELVGMDLLEQGEREREG